MDMVVAPPRHGITELNLPRQNEKNVKEDLTEDLRRELTIHYVTEIAQAVAIALQPSAEQTTLPRPIESEVQPAV
jgi:ATP-dependent Lon protease